MKPISADTPGLKEQPLSSSPSHVPRTPRRREGTGVRAALVSFSVFIIAVAGAFLLRDAVAPLRLTQNGGAERHAVGTIKLAPDQGFCRQMTIDNRTGQMINHGRLPCDRSSAGDSKE
jgi:hypothetical protein